MKSVDLLFSPHVDRWLQRAMVTACSLVVLTQVALVVGLNLNGKARAAGSYPATDVLGQTDANGLPIFTQDFVNNLGLPKSGGFESPGDVQIDTVHHELYVAEGGGADRISVYNLDSSNQLIDRVPDYVLGQPKFGTSYYGATQSELYAPLGIAIDPAGQRLFVADTFNSRVIVYDTSALSTGENASFVLGQPNFTTSASVSTQTGMNHPVSLAFDATGQRLFVVDQNSRVLVFSTSSLVNGEAASNVIGQPNFTASGCAAASATVACPYGLAYDSAGSRLYVSDEIHNRLMVFNTTTITNGMAASNVLGQPNFTSTGAAITQAGLTQPREIAVDSVNNRIFVTDSTRVVTYNTAVVANGENATAVLGQTSFTASATGITQNHFTAYGMFLNPANMRLYISDLPNQRIVIYDVNAITNGQNAIDEMGQTNVDGSLRWTTKYPENNFVNAGGMSLPQGVTEDPVGHRLFVSDSFNGRVLVYNLDSSNNLISHTADYVLGQPDMSTANGGTTQTVLGEPEQLAYDPSRKWLYVADTNNNRVLVYDTTSIVNGEPALYVLGQTDFISKGAGISAAQFNEPMGLTYDFVHQRLFVVDMQNSRVLGFNMASPANGMAATSVIGQSNFTTNAFIGDPSSLYWPQAATYDPVHDRLYVADTWENRVLVFDTSTVTNGMAASYVLGQTDFASYDQGSTTTQTDLGNPQGIFYDPASDRLFVCGWEDRVLVFDTSSLASGMPASAVIGQPDFTTTNAGVSQTLIEDPYGLYVDPTNERMYVSDDWGDRVITFDTVHITTSSLPGVVSGQPYAASVASTGSQGTLTMALTAGSLPPGLAMNAHGAISGTPTTSGTYTFTVTATDDIGSEGSLAGHKQLTIAVTSPPALPPSQPQALSPSPSPTPTATETPSATPTPSPSSTPAPTPSTDTILLNSDPAYTTSDGSVQSMASGSDVTFTLGDTTSNATTTSGVTTDLHTATINAVSGTFVDLTIASDPIKLRLMIGDTKDVDVDRNGTNDISVTLVSISGTTADLVFRQLALGAKASAQPTASSQANTAPKSTAGFTIADLWLLVGATCLVLFAAIAGLIWWWRSRTQQ